MDSQMITIMVIFILTIIYIIYFFNSDNNNNELTHTLSTPVSNENVVPEFDEGEIEDIISTYYRDKKYNTEQESYLRKDQSLCPINKKEHDKFYEKDKYYNNVDRIQQLRDEMDPSNMNQSTQYTGKKIKDIYDELVKNNNRCYTKKCLKEPYIDPYSKQPYYTKNKTISNSQWEYKNECPLNGGAFDKNLYGFDPLQDNHYLSLV